MRLPVAAAMRGDTFYCYWFVAAIAGWRHRHALRLCDVESSAALAKHRVALRGFPVSCRRPFGVLQVKPVCVLDFGMAMCNLSKWPMWN